MTVLIEDIGHGSEDVLARCVPKLHFHLYLTELGLFGVEFCYCGVLGGGVEFVVDVAGEEVGFSHAGVAWLGCLGLRALLLLGFPLGFWLYYMWV